MPDDPEPSTGQEPQPDPPRESAPADETPRDAPDDFRPFDSIKGGERPTKRK
jgi:hypothetical protein